jgi:hypothetical protein
VINTAQACSFSENTLRLEESLDFQRISVLTSKHETGSREGLCDQSSSSSESGVILHGMHTCDKADQWLVYDAKSRAHCFPTANVRTIPSEVEAIGYNEVGFWTNADRLMMVHRQ